MALPVTDFVVNGRDYKTTLLPARAGLILMPKIIALLGRENTTIMLAAGEKGLAKLLANPETMGAMLHEISTKATEDNGLLLLHEVMRHTTCKQIQASESVVEASVYDNFDTHFAGDYLDLFTVAIHAARASFTKPSSAK